MQKNMWLPFWVGFGLIALSFPLIVLMPQARGPEEEAGSTPGNTSETSPLMSETESVLRGYDEELCRCAGESKSRSISCVMGSFFASYYAIVATHRNFQILLGGFCLAGFSNSAMGLLHVYISKRYQWTFARVCPLILPDFVFSADMNEVGYLFSLKAAVNVFMLIICVPVFTRVMARKTKYTPAQVDMLGSKIALGIFAVGALATGSSSELWMLVICEFSMAVFGAYLTLISWKH
jgi:hypothetical protein